MKYTDYLKDIFDFSQTEGVKMKRIADLIQVNMRTVSGNKTFKYVRIQIHICVLSLRFQ
ncbi:hypothetical protein [Marinifilum fragile]